MSLYPKYRSYSFIVAKSLAAFVMFECIGNLPKSQVRFISKIYQVRPLTSIETAVTITSADYRLLCRFI